MANCEMLRESRGMQILNQDVLVRPGLLGNTLDNVQTDKKKWNI